MCTIIFQNLAKHLPTPPSDPCYDDVILTWTYQAGYHFHVWPPSQPVTFPTLLCSVCSRYSASMWQKTE